MPPTYSAILRDGSLIWDEGPPDLPPGNVPVRVTPLDPPRPASNGPAMAAALAAIAALGGPSGIDDPIECQRQARTSAAPGECNA